MRAMITKATILPGGRWLATLHLPSEVEVAKGDVLLGVGREGWKVCSVGVPPLARPIMVQHGKVRRWEVDESPPLVEGGHLVYLILEARHHHIPLTPGEELLTQRYCPEVLAIGEGR